MSNDEFEKKNSIKNSLKKAELKLGSIMRSRLIAPLEGNNEVKYSTVKQFKTQTIRVKYGELKKKLRK
jgi:hypothetical protein